MGKFWFCLVKAFGWLHWQVAIIIISLLCATSCPQNTTKSYATPQTYIYCFPHSYMALSSYMVTMWFAAMLLGGLMSANALLVALVLGYNNQLDGGQEKHTQ